MSDYPDFAVFIDPPFFVGNSLYMEVQYNDSSNVGVDFSGCTFDFKLGAITEATSGVSVTAGATTGQIIITGTATAMAAITAGVHDIELAYVNAGVGWKKTIFKGTFLARESIL